jgi:hypothetical protein
MKNAWKTKMTFQENLSRPGIIDANTWYWAAAQQLRNTALDRVVDMRN